MAATGVFQLSARTYVGPLEQRVLLVEISNLQDMFPSFHKILTGNIFGLILKNKMAAMGVSLSVMKSAYISRTIGSRGLVCQANL